MIIYVDNKPLNKLPAYGISLGFYLSLLTRIRDFLKNKPIRVVVDGYATALHYYSLYTSVTCY